MSDNKKYYYLKLKDNFFDSDSMIILESMENGYMYSNILMKMYLRSLKSNGRLLFNDKIPYNPAMLSKIVRHNVDIVEKAIKLFRELGLIDVLDNGAIYMLDIQNFIGESSSEADRQRAYYSKIKTLKEEPCKKPYMIPTPEIEIEIEKELKIDIKNKYGEYKHVLLTEDQFNLLKSKYDNYNELITYLDEYIEMKGYKAKNHYLAITKWVVDAVSKKPKSKVTIGHKSNNGIDYDQFYDNFEV